ncbi:redoxin domain-containing protein [Gilvimarinus sp. F26214L]|uniref:redoxin domain-containing protein n=1 Tax=Gilvimarinus sp. DZF01 TaxID=3461371 RepID=UPI00404587E8
MKRIASLLTMAALAAPSLAVMPGDKVDNFKLLDHKGKMHELYYMSDKEAVVIMVQGNGCPIVRNANHTFNDLQSEYEDKGVAFLMLNANLQDNRDSIAKEAAEFGIEAPILVDETQLIAESLDVERTADTFVIDPDTWKVVYRGSLDDRLGYETQKQKASNNYVADALDAVLADKKIKVAQTDAKGCLVALPEKERRAEHKQISYSEDIAPILIDKCVDCHRDGGIGPFAMNDYNMIKGFAPMIREVVRTKRMPPWHADPHIGEFSNDRSLSAEQVKTLVHWIEAGAPRGDGPDTLANYEGDWPEWELGEPDVVVEIPAYDVPATGIIDYLNPRAKNPLPEDAWVRAVEIQPGSRQALHHVITTFGVPNDKAPGGFQLMGGLGGYVPGNPGEEFPEGTGIFLPKGAVFNFQMHYTTFGKAVTDKSRMGIYLHKEKPKYPLSAITMLNTQIKIPPHTKEHWEKKETRPLERDILVYSLLPHAHFRGKAATYVARYPDGKEETLLSVPNYDFNWQTTYHLEEPKMLPAGTVIVYNQSWDNSAQNPANPDPTREVPWGEQSFDEMLFGNIKYRYANPRPGDMSSGISVGARD